MPDLKPAAPLWKRCAAAILDFLLAYNVFGLIMMLVARVVPLPGLRVGSVTYSMNLKGSLFEVKDFAALLVICLVAAYFIVLRRNGGTVFQRLFGIA